MSYNFVIIALITIIHPWTTDYFGFFICDFFPPILRSLLTNFRKIKHRKMIRNARFTVYNYISLDRPKYIRYFENAVQCNSWQNWFILQHYYNITLYVINCVIRLVLNNSTTVSLIDFIMKTLKKCDTVM